MSRHAVAAYRAAARADLRDMDLYTADFHGANLDHVNVARTNLFRSNLTGVSLASAENILDWRMEDGLEFSQYLKEVVPALLTAGGKPLAEVVAHSRNWTDCPLAYAFGVGRPDLVPPLYRARAVEFAQLFAPGLTPKPEVDGGPSDPTAA